MGSQRRFHKEQRYNLRPDLHFKRALYCYVEQVDCIEEKENPGSLDEMLFL